MKTLSLLMLLLGLSVAGCTSSQHIRARSYYNYDWSLTNAGSSDPLEHHPIFKDVPNFKEGPPNYTKTLNYFFWGLTPWRQEVKMSQACGTLPFRQAYVQHTFGQALISFFTIGIYTPRTVEVWCGDIQQARN